MDNTISLLAKTLGARGVEASGHDVRFAVEAADGSRLKVATMGSSQRLMATLIDGQGVTRGTIDVAPVTRALEDHKAFPGRVTLQVGKMLVHIDSQPTLGFEIVTEET